MPAEPQTLTLAQAVHRAVEVCEDSRSQSLDDMLERFEDADEPITAIESVESRLNEALGPAEADDGDAALTMARAIVVYLAHRRDEIDADPVELLALTARAEFGAHPPDYVGAWLSARGIAV